MIEVICICDNYVLTAMSQLISHVNLNFITDNSVYYRFNENIDNCISFSKV